MFLVTLLLNSVRQKTNRFAVDEDVMDISKRLIAKNKKTYEVLAK